MGPSAVSRGDIWLVDLGLAAKVRPVVVLSVAYLDHERAVATYIPRTTSLPIPALKFRIRRQVFNPAPSMRKASEPFPSSNWFADWARWMNPR